MCEGMTARRPRASMSSASFLPRRANMPALSRTDLARRAESVESIFASPRAQHPARTRQVWNESPNPWRAHACMQYTIYNILAQKSAKCPSNISALSTVYCMLYILCTHTASCTRSRAAGAHLASRDVAAERTALVTGASVLNSVVALQNPASASPGSTAGRRRPPVSSLWPRGGAIQSHDRAHPAAVTAVPHLLPARTDHRRAP